MANNILLTGAPRSGKTTILNTVIRTIPNKVGFVTNEIRENGNRVGFEVQTHLGATRLLASKKIKTPYRVGDYSVTLDRFEALLPKVGAFTATDVLYLDEIGQMELFSKTFKKLVLKYLNAPNFCLATISKIYTSDFLEEIRHRDDVVLYEVTEETRDQVLEKITSITSSILQ